MMSADLSPTGRQVLIMAALVLGSFLTACSGGPSAPIDCPSQAPFIETDAESRVDVWFCSRSTALAGSLYAPEDPQAGVVFVHGSGEVPRLGNDNPVVEGLHAAGIAVFTYDKRGVGDSQGECCPADDGEFSDLIADAEAAIGALKAIPGYRGLPIGIYGESQAAWIAPPAAAQRRAAFLILTSAPPISWGEEILHEELTDQGLDQDSIRALLADTPPSGFDPRARVADLGIPMLWIYGSEDTVIPVEYSIDVLAELTSAHDLELTVEVLDGAGHSVIHHPDLFPTVAGWACSPPGPLAC